MRVEAGVDDRLRLAEDPVHLWHHQLHEDRVELLRCLRLQPLIAGVVAIVLPLLGWRLTFVVPSSHPSELLLLLVFESFLYFQLPIKSSLQAALPQEVLLRVYLRLRDLQVILVVVHIAIGRVIVLVFEVLESLLLV